MPEGTLPLVKDNLLPGQKKTIHTLFDLEKREIFFFMENNGTKVNYFLIFVLIFFRR